MTTDTSDRPILIIGAGGHGKVVAEALLQGGCAVLGFTDPSVPKGTAVHAGLKVLGDDAIVKNYATDDVLLANGVGSLPGGALRADIYSSFKNKKYSFATVLHPSAVVSSDAQLGEGAQVMASVVLQPGVQIGANSIINTSASIDHDCLIGDNCHIAPGSVLSGGVHVGKNVHIGTGAKVIQSIHIKDNAVVGAGAVVLSDVDEGKTVVGCPARAIVKEN